MTAFPTDLALPDDDDNNESSTFKGSAGQQGTNIPMGWKPTKAEPVPVVRCTAKIRNGPKQGEQCTKWSIRGATVCLQHGGHLPNVREHAQSVVEAARMKLVGLAPEAVDALEDLVQTGTADQIRLAAAKEILDRSGIVKGTEITVVTEERVSAADIIAEKLKMMAARQTADKKKDEPLEDLGEQILDEDDDA